MTDADASLISFAPIRTTVAALAALPPHCGVSPDRRVYAEELQVYEVVGRIIIARSEDDHDYHVALVDPAAATATMVTEIADPPCAGPVPHFARSALESARLEFGELLAGRSLSALAGETVVVRGVGFYDQNHGQTGRSASCIELHPVLSIARVEP